MKKFIGDLCVIPSKVDHVMIFNVNDGAIALAKEPRQHKRTRHILRKYNYIRKLMEDGNNIVSRV